ncbi:MAG TPA: 3-phosphoshikimate 1-carboxyvinyltransferase [Firmicutes bacterium]|jgi:3-phosphoshikimate 1-carboxyvinyltransferase|nr:3-phosphoshikimate 1-carboxyvinyltransferase [Bacillota bacterium]HOQ23775.1 3-phosphoshikimate 1-carboxyvinyltransferase [Bacillota bacterium]HPT66919.1 3-phosphoshikimate 1-carboxyvinyltransferase [Bacillota bacterium]
MLAIVKPAKRLMGSVAAPPSKNYTSRYIWLAALTDGVSEVIRPAWNDDARALITACRALGAEIREAEDRLVIRGFAGAPRAVSVLNPGNGGLILRLLLALGIWLPDVVYTTEYMDSLGRRPQDDLLAALTQLGVEVQANSGRLPIHLKGQGCEGGMVVEVSGAKSSQFATALLLVAPLMPKGLTVRVVGGLRSKPPLQTTLAVMAEAGVVVAADWERLSFTVPAGARYQARVYRVPGDYPGAAALLAAAAVLPSDVRVSELYPDAQGERKVLDGLVQMGVDLSYDYDGKTVSIKGGKPLRRIRFNGDEATDAVLALAAAAAFAEGETSFYNVGNLRFKESDRIGDFGAELRKIGVCVEEGQEELIIKGSPAGYGGGVTVDAHHDHRIIMAATVIGLASRQGLCIRGAEHISKSFPDFFTTLTKLGASIELAEES